ncbi:hypothetical protein B0H19DRAFT_1167590 [Mycena capillaripes]|nr:hypothetical protein B0H19DRAFT_1167590 [Mycena capillaripes]
MSNYAVFITAAARATPKVVNRAFVLIHDFQYNEWPATYGWTLLTSQTLPITPPTPTTVPLPDAVSTSNAFAALSLAEIHVFVRTHEAALLELNISNAQWLVIDQRSLETSTGIVCEQVFIPRREEDELGAALGAPGYTVSDFRACRLPYEEAWGMIVGLRLIINLGTARLKFEPWVDEGAGVQPDGTWKWKSFKQKLKEDDTSTEGEVKREQALKALRDGGYVD